MTTQIIKKRSDNKGFSLVELVIVIAIMAVLIAILAPQFIKYVEQSRISADKTTIDEMVRAVNAELAVDGTVSAPTLTATTYTITYAAGVVSSSDTALSTALATLNIPTSGTALRSRDALAASITLTWTYTATSNLWKLTCPTWPSTWGTNPYA